MSTTTAMERVLAGLADAGCTLSNGGRAATCPAHEDRAPSLSIGTRKDKAGVLLRCHAGCSLEDVLTALKLNAADLFDEPGKPSAKSRLRSSVVARYAYTDEAGTLLYEKVRLEPKDFRQRRPDGSGGWSWSLGDTRRVLYRLPAVLAAVAAGETVYVCEGEKDADAVTAAGGCGTTWTEGAWREGTTPKWKPVYTQALTGAHVVVVRDRDDTGLHTASSIAVQLEGVATTVVVVEPTEGKDASDHLTAGRTLADLAPAESAPVAPVAPDAPLSPGPPSQSGAEAAQPPLDEVRAWLSRYVKTMTPGDLDLLTLWAVHTHLALETYTTPRLVLDSPVPGSGKTTVLDHLSRLCVAPVQAASLSSPALLARMLDAGLRTILIDEADRSLDPKREGVAELLAILNSGYRRGGTRPVLVPSKGGEWAVKEMPTFSPVAMAGNNPALPEDTRQRCIRVLLLPDTTGAVHESDWELIDDDARALGRRVAAWADHVRDEVRTARPPLPEGVTGRAREKWAPMKRVAVVAGGHWPEAVDALAMHDKEQSEMDREDGMIRTRPHVALLGHLLEVWPTGETFAPTADLIAELVHDHPDVWGDGSPIGKALTPHRLGRMLATHYKVNSTRLERTGPRGYTYAALAPAWRAMGLFEDTTTSTAPDAAPLRTNPPKESGASGASGETGARPAPSSQARTGPRAPLPTTDDGRPLPCPECGLRPHHRVGCTWGLATERAAS